MASIADNLPACTRYAQTLQGLPKTWPRAPMPEASPAQQAAIKANLARRYGEGLLFAFTQTPALIGGLRVQVGSEVFDGSVQARLAALESSF